jgi:hypothetical protein
LREGGSVGDLRRALVMAEQSNSSSTFVRAFIPGLVLGFVPGVLLGAFVSAIIPAGRGPEVSAGNGSGRTAIVEGGQPSRRDERSEVEVPANPAPETTVPDATAPAPVLPADPANPVAPDKKPEVPPAPPATAPAQPK